MRILEEEVSEILAYFRERKLKLGRTLDVIHLSRPGCENPIDHSEAPTFFDVQFFDHKGKGVVSTTPDDGIALAFPYTNSWQMIWVRPGCEALIPLYGAWRDAHRIRSVEKREEY
jgi:hypothetical protein